MTVVKICGLRRFDDVMAATAVGADVLGFNFWAGTKRCVAARDAAGMIAALRAENGPLPLACGLFVNADAAEIAATVAQCGLDLVQLAGDETPEDVARLAVPVIKTLRPLPDEEASAFRARAETFRAAAHDLPPGPLCTPLMILLDANVPGHYGGTGQRGNWSLATQYSSRPECPRRPQPFFLAGGLTPENVGAAVRAVRPWGVDTASGVEVPGQPGVKDGARLRAFVAAVRAAEAEGMTHVRG